MQTRREQDVTRVYAHHDEATVFVAASPEVVFDRLDNQARFGEHMQRPSLMMAGGSMQYELDEAGGRELGSVIRMRGTMLGLGFFVEEVVTEREAPRHKAWETRGDPRLLVIDHYRMGFDIAPHATGSQMRVFIDYNRPTNLVGRFLSLFFARTYARWCVRRVADDAVRVFAVAQE